MRWCTDSVLRLCAVTVAARNTKNSHQGGVASSQTNTAAHTGARWVIATTPAAVVSATAGTLIAIPVHALIARVTTDPVAAPVARAGVNMPPTAPARKTTAVRRGLRNRITAAAPSVGSPFKTTVRML